MAQSYARAQAKSKTCAIHSEFLSAAALSNMDKPWRRPGMDYEPPGGKKKIRLG